MADRWADDRQRSTNLLDRACRVSSAVEWVVLATMLVLVARTGALKALAEAPFRSSGQTSSLLLIAGSALAAVVAGRAAHALVVNYLDRLWLLRDLREDRDRILRELERDDPRRK